MSKYKGLDKIDISKTTFEYVETYRKVKIYIDTCDQSYAVVSRNYLVDEGWNTLDYAKGCVDHFLEE